jgi:hypothetical protein
VVEEPLGAEGVPVLPQAFVVVLAVGLQQDQAAGRDMAAQVRSVTAWPPRKGAKG